MNYARLKIVLVIVTITAAILSYVYWSGPSNDFKGGMGSYKSMSDQLLELPPEHLSHGQVMQQVNTIMNQVNTSGKITDKQAERLVRLVRVGGLELNVNGLTSITDEQAESLSKVRKLELNGLTTITAAQAKSLSKVRKLELDGLTSITDAQAKSLLPCTEPKTESQYLNSVLKLSLNYVFPKNLFHN